MIILLSRFLTCNKYSLHVEYCKNISANNVPPATQIKVLNVRKQSHVHLQCFTQQEGGVNFTNPFGLPNFHTDSTYKTLQFHHMTSVEISQESGYWQMRNFPTPSDSHSNGSWDESKKPYPLRNCTIPNSATVGAPRPTQPAASWLLDPDGCLIGNQVISQWLWILAMIHQSCIS